MPDTPPPPDKGFDRVLIAAIVIAGLLAAAVLVWATGLGEGLAD